MKTRSFLFVAAIALALAGNTQAAIEPGDVIKLDFSNSGDGDGGLSNWNTVISGNTITNPIRHSDGAQVSGVNVSITNWVNNNYNNDGGAANWGGTAGDPYYVLGADDIYFHGSSNDLSVTFGGLDSDLKYNVGIYSLIGNNGHVSEGFRVTNGDSTEYVENTRAVRWGATSLTDAGTFFEELMPNVGNEISITIDDLGGSYYPLNAIVLEALVPPAVPEPATLFLASLGLIGAVVYRRRRKV